MMTDEMDDQFGSDELADDNEFIESTRENIIEILDLWASKERQFELQESIPVAHVSTALFIQWFDFFVPDAEVMEEAFSSEELYRLNQFNSRLNEIWERSDKSLPVIFKFAETGEWVELNRMAAEMIKIMKEPG